ncbi:uncharacterized protein JCM6883_004569 [Sporobolomyces salmoneus]|uniref:uncharacterized protein n=1 Tax=Sporobolomyces salmoneus TaxID=183962 RepID=UPI00316FCA18
MNGAREIDLSHSDYAPLDTGDSGNLESTTKPASTKARRDVVVFNSTQSDQAWSARRAAEERVAANDEDLDSYFEAFPEQASMSVSHLVKRQDSTNTTDTLPTSTSTATSTASTTIDPTPTPTRTPSPRQRNEFLTWPGAPAGSTWRYTWKSFQSTSTSTTPQFFHAWQILRRDASGGPVLTLGYQNGQVRISDSVRGCSVCAQPFPAAGVAYWFGKTISHTLTITYGLNGSATYSAYSDTNLRRPLITYEAQGDMGSSASLKYGNYRAVVNGISAATAYVGDLVSTRLS